jgi:thymidylate synthase (FAD)
MILSFRDDVLVRLQGHYGTDLDICRAAWVSSGQTLDDPSEKRQRGLIRALLRERHGTPFETGYLQFYAETSRAVRDEAVRHRHLSFSCSSLRYTHERFEVYVPPRHRPLKKGEGFKQIQPVYVPLSDDEYDAYVGILKDGYLRAAQAIEALRALGRDETEATRWLTTDGHYVSFIMRMNPRSLMHFLGLRTHNDAANHVSYPMFEIRQMADQMEAHFAEHWPLTYAAWNEFGREAP